MRWDLEERTEDAFVAYLKQNVTGTMRVCAAWERDEMEYPCVLVHAGTTAPLADDAAWHDPRMLVVQVSVATEGAHELDGSNNVQRTAREINADARSSVLNALAVSNLNAQLVAQAVPGVAFSMAQMTQTQRDVDGRNLVTVATVEVIAEPVTGT